MVSPAIHGIAVTRRAWREPRARPMWFKVMKVLALALIVAAVVGVLLVVIGSLMMVFD